MQKNRNHNKLSDHSAIKLELRIKNVTQNCASSWKTKQLAPECQLDKQWNEGRNKDVLQNQQEWRHSKPNLWDTFKAVSREKFIAINAHMRRKEGSKIETLSSKLKEVEEQDQKTQNLAEDKK